MTRGSSTFFEPPSLRLRRPRLDLCRLPFVIHNHQWLSPIRIPTRPLVCTTPSIWHAHADREIRLQLVHARLHLVLFYRLPDIGRPVLVQIVRILHKEHLVGINLVLLVRFKPNGHWEHLTFFLKHSHHFHPPRAAA